MAASVRAGDVLAGRYRMVDLLVEDDGAWLWNAHDRLLHRPVALHLLDATDERADAMVRAARVAARISDRRNLRVLDCNRTETLCYVVNEWGQGTSLDIALLAHGPMPPVRAAWLVHEVADILVNIHAAGAAHGRLLPENVLIDENGEVRIIGSGVDAALRALPFDDQDADVHALVSLLYATLTGRWPGTLGSAVPDAPHGAGRVLRPRQVRAGIPRPLDVICDEVLNGADPHTVPGNASGGGLSGGLGAGISNGLSNGLGAVLGQREFQPLRTAEDVRDALQAFLGEHEPELPSATQLAPPPQGLAPVQRPWQPPREEPSLTSASTPSSSPATGTPTSTPPSTPSGSGATVSGAASGSPRARAAAPEARTEQTETQDGLPVFGEQDEAPRAQPDEDVEPAARPLFAPESDSRVRRERLAQLSARTDSSQGSGRRSGGAHRASPRSRPEPAPTPAVPPPARASEDYWIWDTTSSGTGSGLIPVVPGGPVPGRNWMRLALLVGVAALALLLGVAWIYAQRPGADDAGTRPATATRTPSPAAQPTPITGLAASDLDPQGNPPEEYPEQTPLAVDGDPTTFWGTSTYKEQFGPGGLKSGVGLVVDLGEAKDVRQVRVTVLGGATTAELFVTDQAPVDVRDLQPVARAEGSDTLTFALEEPTTGQFVTVWLTAVPVQDGGHRGKVAEVEVFG